MPETAERTTVRELILDLATGFCMMPSIETAKLDDWERKLAGHDAETVEKAIEDYKSAAKRGRNGRYFMPFPDDILKRLGSKGSSKPTAHTGGWFRPDGQWGGDWSGSSKAGLIRAAAVMVGSICPGFDTHGDRREAFLDMAERRGCRRGELLELGAIFAKSGIGALNIEISKRLGGGE